MAMLTHRHFFLSYVGFIESTDRSGIRLKSCGGRKIFFLRAGIAALVFYMSLTEPGVHLHLLPEPA